MTISTTTSTTSTTKIPPKNDNNNKPVLMCYLSYLFNKRSGIANFTVDNIDPNLCTHIVYSMVKINDTTHDNLVPFSDDTTSNI